jgi:hypothetical protein
MVKMALEQEFSIDIDMRLRLPRGIDLQLKIGYHFVSKLEKPKPKL